MKQGWELRGLGEVCDLQGGSQPPKSDFRDEQSEGYIRLLQIRDFKSDDKAVYVPVTNRLKMCDSTDIMIARYGASVGQIHTGKAGAYNVALMRTIPDEARLCKLYLYYYLISPLFQKPLALVSKRGAQDGFNKDDINPFQIPLPPLDEQKRIVAVLDEAFEGFETACANAEANLKNAEELFDSAVTNILAEIGNVDHVDLQSVTTLITKGSSPKWQGFNYVSEPGLLFITSENVLTNQLSLAKSKFVDEAFNEKEKKSVLKVGDVLTNIVGASIGRTCVYNIEDVANINQAVCLIRCDGSKLNNYFLSFLLNSPLLIKTLHENEVDMARANLSLGFFRDFRIPLPNMSTQKRIVAKCNELSKERRTLTAMYMSKLRELSGLRQSLLQKAFAGELT